MESRFCESRWPHQRCAENLEPSLVHKKRMEQVHLVSLLRTFQPRRLNEIGAGFSSAATLDATKRSDIELTFIDPNPRSQLSLSRIQTLREFDLSRCRCKRSTFRCWPGDGATGNSAQKLTCPRHRLTVASESIETPHISIETRWRHGKPLLSRCFCPSLASGFSP